MTEARSGTRGNGLPGTTQPPFAGLPGALPETVMRYWRVALLRTPDELKLAYALRYRVYCEERGFLSKTDYPEGIEQDEFDDYSIHFGSFNAEGEIVGAARLVMPGPRAYPMFRHCTVEAPWKRKIETTPRIVEISRLVVSRQYRRRANDGHYGIQHVENVLPLQSDPLDRRQQFSVAVSLFKAMYHAAWHLQVTHALSAMELTLLRLLQRYHFPFEKIGPECDYYGPVTPFILDVAQTEKRLAADNPDMLREFHNGLTAGQAASLVI